MKYNCEECKKECPQVYGGNFNGKYTEKCSKCFFKKVIK